MDKDIQLENYISTSLQRVVGYIYPEQLKDWIKFVRQANKDNNLESVEKVINLLHTINSKFIKNNEFKFNTNVCSLDDYIWVFNPVCYFSKNGEEFFNYLTGVYSYYNKHIDTIIPHSAHIRNYKHLLMKKSYKQKEDLIKITKKKAQQASKKGLEDLSNYDNDLIENIELLLKLKHNKTEGYMILNHHYFNIKTSTKESIYKTLFNTSSNISIDKINEIYEVVNKYAPSIIEDKYLNNFEKLVKYDYKQDEYKKGTISNEVLFINELIKNTSLDNAIEYLESKNYDSKLNSLIKEGVLLTNDLGKKFYLNSCKNGLTKEELIKLQNQGIKKDEFISDELINTYKNEYNFFLKQAIKEFAYECRFDINEANKDELIKFMVDNSNEFKISDICYKVKDLLESINNEDQQVYLNKFNNLIDDKDKQKVLEVILKTSYWGIDFYKLVKSDLNQEDLKLIKEVEEKNKKNISR